MTAPRTRLLLMGLIVAAPMGAWELGDVVRDSGAAGNVAADPSFEANSWRLADGATVGMESGRIGGPGIKARPTEGARIERGDDKSDPSAISPRFPVAPGRWLVSGWLRTAMPYSRDPNYSATLEIAWLDQAGEELGAARAAAVNGVTHVWVYRERAAIAPPGTAQAELRFRFNWSSVGVAELDDVAVTPAPEGEGAGAPLAISLRAVERIFEPGEALGVRAKVRLAQGPPETVKLQMEVTDSRGKVYSAGGAEVEARPDRDTEATIRAEPCEAPRREHLIARITTDPPRGEPHRFGLLVIPRPTDFSLQPDSPFALLVGHPYTKRWLGARWERPNFNWNEREMELAKRYGVIYVGMINQANQALRGEVSLEEYGAFVHESVGRFKQLVKYWQLGNEPNLYQPGVPERWAEVLRVGYQAAKRADPDCKVMWGGITGLNVDPEMVDKLLAAGGGEHTDIIDVHLYVPIPEMDRLLTKVRADMKKHGVDKPITITEVTGALGTVLPEREKAAHVYKRYAVAESHGVLASWWFVMHWVNTGEFRYCSLIDPGTGEPHEAAAAYARLTEALEGAEFARRLESGDGAWVYEWRKGGRSVYIAWAEGREATGAATLPCGTGPGTVTDVAGHQWQLRVQDSLTISLRDEPLLVDVPATASGDVAARQLEFDPPGCSLARGASQAIGMPELKGTIQLDAPAGLQARRDGDGLAVTALPDALLGEHWLVVREQDGETDTAFLRLKATVTPPLRLALSPLPAAGGQAAVRAQVTNLSGDPLAGALTVASPVSAGTRIDRIEAAFKGLAPGETGEVELSLEGLVDPAARYDFELGVETADGVRDTLRRTLVFAPARRTGAPPDVDGKLDDWPEALYPAIIVGLDTGERGDPQDGPPTGPGDLSAEAALAWDEANLYLAVRVRDDVHSSDQRDGALWDGDGLQFGFAPEPYVANSPYYEWGVALTGGEAQAWSWRALPRQPTGEIEFPCRIVRGEGETVYEAAIPWKMLAPIEPRAGTTFGWGLCVNEKDTANRGYYCWHAGIAGEKDRARFGQVTLVE